MLTDTPRTPPRRRLAVPPRSVPADRVAASTAPADRMAASTAPADRMAASTASPGPVSPGAVPTGTVPRRAASPVVAPSGSASPGAVSPGAVSPGSGRPAGRRFVALALHLTTLLLSAGRHAARRLRALFHDLLAAATRHLSRVPLPTRALLTGSARHLRQVRPLLVGAARRLRQFPPRLAVLRAGTVRRVLPRLAVLRAGTVRRVLPRLAVLRAGTVRRVLPRLAVLRAGTVRRLHLLAMRVPAVRRRREERARLHAEAAEARRYADELQVAAARATRAADRWQQQWQRAEQDATEAWQSWQDAEERLARVRAAAAFRAPRTRRTAAEFADREKYLHRAVAAAVERGDLPATVLADLAAGEGGWNPRLHPVDQELVLHRGFAAVRHHLYQRADAVEKAAWHDAQLALTSRDSLRREMTAAITRAAALRHHIQASPTPSNPRSRTGTASAWSAWRSGWTETPAVARVR